MMAMLVIFSLGLILLAQSRWLPLSAVALVITGSMTTTYMSLNNSLMLEQTPPGLTARILLAAQVRARRSRAGRRLRAFAVVCAILGLALVVVSAPELGRALNNMTAGVSGGVSSTAFDQLLNAPLDTVSGMADGLLGWQQSFAEEIGGALLLGLTLLALASLSGLAQLLDRALPVGARPRHGV